jgi:hypothetical protein
LGVSGCLREQVTQRTDERLRCLPHLPPGESQDAKAQGLKVGVAGAVTLERPPVPVVSETVGLDDQTTVAPEEVDLMRAEAHFHVRLGKAMATAQTEEEAFEFAAGQIGLRREVSAHDQAAVEGLAKGTRAQP